MSTANLKEKRVGVLMGGLSAEREVSLQSGQAVLEALLSRGYDAVGIDVDTDVCQRLAAAEIAVAFIALHGRYGEDGCVQGLLEAMQVPYTGSGVRASAVAMDKITTKRLLAAAGLPQAAWRYPGTARAAHELGLPLVVKPRGEGSSVGLTVVRDDAALEAALALAGATADDRLVERYIAGRELSVAVLGSKDSARALGSVEIRPAEGLYDYAAKYTRDDTQYLVPAPVPAEIIDRITELALEAHRLLECSGATRTDFIWDGADELVVLELNTIPGMTSHSLLPKIAAHAGMSYADLVEAMLEEASLKAGAAASGAPGGDGQ